MTEVGRLAHDAYKPFFTKVEKVPASIHRIAANDYSRKPGFRHTGFSETKKISGYRRGPGYWRQRFPSPSPFPQGVMWRIHTQMSVPGVTKCHRVQTFLVIQRVAMRLDDGASFEDESVLSRPQGEDSRRCSRRDVQSADRSHFRSRRYLS